MKNNLKIVYFDIHSLQASNHDFRLHTQEVIDKLKKSITEHSMVSPIIVNSSPARKGIIIAGEMRWKACKELNHKTIPCIEVSVSDIEKEKALSLRLNAITGEWNEETLKQLNETFLLDVGFSPNQLDVLYADVMDTEDDDFSVLRELEDIEEPQSKLGDLYQLGSHRLICGSSEDPEVIKRLVGDKKMDMIYNDPIYAINYNYKSGISKTKNYGGSEKDNLNKKQYEEFLRKTIKNALEVSKPDVHVFYYSDQKYASLVQKLHEEEGLTFKRTCIWLKTIANPTPQIAFSKIYEPVTYSTRGKPYLNKQYQNFNELLNKEFTNGHRVLDEFYDMIDVWAVKRLSTNLYEHPTEKPVVLHDKPIKRCTKIGDNILSMFGGSGGEMIAAEQLKRRVFMAELDPVFVDLIIRRYEKFTGLKAIKLN